MPSSSLHWLREQGLLKASASFDSAEIPFSSLLLRLCDSGELVGGLSVARDLEVEELFGPLTLAMGGHLAKLKLSDVRAGPLRELQVGDQLWEVPSLRALIGRLNEEAASDPTAKCCALLGEWEEMLQLWVVPRKVLRLLVKRPDFQPENEVVSFLSQGRTKS